MNEDPEALFGSLQSLFGDLFGPSAQRDLHEPLVVELAEAAEGAERTVELSRATACRACRGSGGAPGATRVPCEACAGRGGERRTEGHFSFAKTCEACHGAAGRWTVRCPACEGCREVSASKRLRVTIPPGVAAGHVLRLARQGHDLGDGRGDALLTIEIAPHPHLRREGDDLHARVRLEGALVEIARRGGETSVPWLKGTARVRVPAGAAHGTRARVRGWGCVRLGSAYAPPPSDEAPYRSAAPPARGDLVVTFVTHEEDVDDAPRDAAATPLDLTDVLSHFARDRDDPVDRALREHDAPAPIAASPRAVALGIALLALALGTLSLLAR